MVCLGFTKTLILCSVVSSIALKQSVPMSLVDEIPYTALSLFLGTS